MSFNMFFILEKLREHYYEKEEPVKFKPKPPVEFVRLFEKN